MRKMPFFILLFILFSQSCSFLEDTDELVYMEYDGAYLPIYSRGNKDSDVVILWTHGGPGSSGMYYGDIDEISSLHNDYHIIYWDQLSSGGSMGNPDKDDFTVENFSNQLDGVVNIVNNRYKPKKLYLLGHSWGGYLVSYYLADSVEHQENFEGLILLNPILDIPRALTTSIEYVDEYAKDKISIGEEVDFWKDALDWYSENLTDTGILIGENIATHYDYIEETGGMLKKRDRNDELEFELGIKMALFSPFHFYNYYSNQSNIRTYLQIEDASLDNVKHNGDQTLSNITIKTLFIAGDDDKIASIEMSKDWEGQFGSTIQFKEYSDCAHAAFLDRPEMFLDDIRDFAQ